jgi:phosphopantothenoylcysteine decarboxylase/phosphopantothenate--cysteine ligase
MGERDDDVRVKTPRTESRSKLRSAPPSAAPRSRGLRLRTHPRRLSFLITAGPTREYIDPVRYLSNDSSGRMGFAIANAALRRGHRVTLVHGPVNLLPVEGAQQKPVVSAAEMLRACRKAWNGCDVLVMAAAVADYAPARPRKRKVKRSRNQSVLELKPTRDVLATLSRSRRAGQIVIGFALEDRAGRRNAAEKLEAKRLDAIVLNRPSAIGSEQTRVEILVRGAGWRALPPMSKSQAAVHIIECSEQLAAAARSGPRVMRRIRG